MSGHTDAVHALAFTNGLTLASGSEDDTIKLWDMNASDAAYGTCLNTLTGHTDAVWSVAYAPNGLTLASGSNDQTIKLWDVN